MSTELFVADYAQPAAGFTRIAVAAGPRMVCDAFTARLVAEEGLHAISAPGDIYQATQTARTFSPDVVVVDLTMFKEPEDVIVRELALYLSIETVRTHMCTIMNKLDVHSAIAAAAVGRASGMQPARRNKEQRAS